MKLGKFSISLSVKNLQASKAFYQKLGFIIIDGKEEQNWLIMANGDSKIGLFQGMFPTNCLTFNPQAGDTDIREIQSYLKAQGIELTTETDPNGEGAGHIAFLDPDGNPVLIDQF
ncbi:MAG: VOC family protein [Bacteroidia bacterium]